jgi:hypothetical protein
VIMSATQSGDAAVGRAIAWVPPCIDGSLIDLVSEPTDDASVRDL